jgi:hypothetical protein
MVAVAWVPITVVAGWVLVHEQPVANSFRDNVREWSADLGVADAVGYLSPFVSVLALGIGLVFGLALLASPAMRREQAAVEEAPARQPVTHLSAPVPFTAAPGDRADGETAVAGDGSRRRETLIVP